MTALSVVLAVGEEPEISASADSPWTKFCQGEICTVGKDRRSYCRLIAEVMLVERKTETRKVLSIGLPTRINSMRAVRIIIDRNEPVSRSISRCDNRGCWADYETGPELVEQLKQGQMLGLEAVNRDDTPYTAMIPLAGFAEVYAGPPIPMPEMKVQTLSEAQMNALREQEKRAAEERRMRCGPSP